jgi:hypothetical protein
LLPFTPWVPLACDIMGALSVGLIEDAAALVRQA